MISRDIEVRVWYLCPNFVFGYSLTGNSLSFQKGMLPIFQVGTLPHIAGGGGGTIRFGILEVRKMNLCLGQPGIFRSCPG